MLEKLSDRAVLHIKGQDSQIFLQGQTTNDLIKNKYSYNFILNNQGRYLFDFLIFKENTDSFYVDIAARSAIGFIRKLNLCKLRRNIIIEDISENYTVTYSDYQLEKAVFCLPDPRNQNLLFRSVIEQNILANFKLDISGSYLADKYKYVIIDGDMDMIPEKSIPIEYGVEAISAIDYHKGCYVGQEVISRAKYQGVIRKNIYKLELAEEIDHLPIGEVVTDLQGNKIGILCSAYKNIAIIQIRIEKYQNMNEKMAILSNKKGKIQIPVWHDQTEGR